MPASVMCAGVSKSGSPISRWMMSRPACSIARARARTESAVSVPTRATAAPRWPVGACSSVASIVGLILSDDRQLRRGDLAHDELLHLAGDRHREGVDDLPIARDLVGGDPPAAGGVELMGAEGAAVA